MQLAPSPRQYPNGHPVLREEARLVSGTLVHPLPGEILRDDDPAVILSTRLFQQRRQGTERFRTSL
jgi:hypothetical protein